MNKKSLKFICGTLLSVLLFSSCLGDGENSRQSGVEFAYITSANSVPVAKTSTGMMVTSQEISLLPQGSCYLISYKVSSTSGSTNGVMNAENVTISQDPVSQSYLSNSVPVVRLDSLPVKEFYVSAFYPDNFLGDRWLFSGTTSLKQGESIRAEFYYDVKNQKENGVALKDNQVILDVRFIRTNVSTDITALDRDQSFLVVGDLGSLRASFPLVNPSNQKTNLIIKFRYHRYQKDAPATVLYIGDWDANSAYFMTFGS
jgi:hypothetical protein